MELDREAPRAADGDVPVHLLLPGAPVDGEAVVARPQEVGDLLEVVSERDLRVFPAGLVVATGLRRGPTDEITAREYKKRGRRPTDSSSNRIDRWPITIGSSSSYVLIGRPPIIDSTRHRAPDRSAFRLASEYSSADADLKQTWSTG